MTVWDILRQEFSINHEINQPAVQTELQWLLSHPGFIQKVCLQSKPYIFHVLTEIKKRHIPGELALVPMIESSFDPFAYSRVGAAGIWQFMPATGTDLGLKQDWWFDARRSITSSTNAALNYLSRLSRYFNGHWELAIAAYDAGEGTLSRAINASGQSFPNISFWQLPLPQETKSYVPRLLALAEIIQHPDIYHIALPDIPYTPFFEEVDVGSQIDLSHAARLAGISYQDLISLNPGFNRWATAPYKPFTLLLPAEHVANFIKNLAITPVTSRVSLAHYTVRKDDSLMSIADAFHSTVNLIYELNQMSSLQITQGQILLIPSPKNTVASIQSTKEKPHYFHSDSNYKILHIVQKNETFANIANRYHVSLADVFLWNHLEKYAVAEENQQLIIFKQTFEPRIYEVKTGDTLSMIAQKKDTTVNRLRFLNPKLNENLLKPGQMLYTP